MQNAATISEQATPTPTSISTPTVSHQKWGVVAIPCNAVVYHLLARYVQHLAGNKSNCKRSAYDVACGAWKLSSL